MKSVILLSLIGAIIPMSLASIAIGLPKDPYSSEKCVWDTITLSPGEEYSLPGKCKKVVCHQGYTTVFSCGVIGVPRDFVLGNPLYPDAAYPKCCERNILPASNYFNK